MPQNWPLRAHIRPIHTTKWALLACSTTEKSSPEAIRRTLPTPAGSAPSAPPCSMRKAATPRHASSSCASSARPHPTFIQRECALRAVHAGRSSSKPSTGMALPSRFSSPRSRESMSLMVSRLYYLSVFPTMK